MAIAHGFKYIHDNVKDPAIGTALRIVNGVVVGRNKRPTWGIYLDSKRNDSQLKDGPWTYFYGA